MNIQKKRIIITIVILAIILAALIGVLAGLLLSTDTVPPANSADTTTVPPTDSTDTTTVPPTDSTDTTTVPPTDSTDTTTVPPTDSTEQGSSETVARPVNPIVPPTASVTEPTKEQTPTTTVPSDIQFPYTIPGTKLVLEAVNPYSGVFLEDGSDRDANNVYAIILRNTAPTCAEYINITLTREDEKQLVFVASAIDANSAVVVMESNAEVYKEMGYSDCSANIAQITKLEMSENLIKVEEDASGSLIVTNISNADIPCVRIFYKFYMEDADVYVGGITYTAKIENLAAGETKTLMPSHYAQNNSRIVMIKVYDTIQ